jgi:acetyltransferase-like isoleucine patch superfamily enzyme
LEKLDLNKLEHIFVQIFKKLQTRNLIKQKDRDRNLVFHGSTQPRLNIGTHTYANGLTIYCWNSDFELSIGKYCSIADNVTVIAGGEHHMERVSSYPFSDRWKLVSENEQPKALDKGGIKIGHDVWIGHGATILSGVSIGHGAVIGAMAVVTKNVEPYSVVVGNPAKHIKSRFPETLVESLIKIKWWDWPENKIKESQELFQNPEAFISKYGVINE